MRERNPTNELRQKQHGWAPCAAVAAGQGENHRRHVVKPRFFFLGSEFCFHVPGAVPTL